MKYWLFGYNAIDLAIYNQVFWNSVRGDLFVQTLHPHSYLGDHAEFAVVLLLPLYAIWKDPRTLLLLQTAALALAAVPLFFLARRRFESLGLGGKSPLLALLIAAAWLICPLTQNANLFEFHLLAFAPLPLFFALLEYDRARHRRFLIWCAAALLVREDVALAVFGIGLLAWFEKRSWFWRLAPMVFATGWFLAAMAVVSKFAPAGHYKYMIYYSWLGGTPFEMASFPLRHPVQFIRHLLTAGNLEMSLGLLMPVAFLPLIKPKRLIIAALPLLQTLISSPGGSSIVVETHYSLLMLPALFLAAVDGLATTATRRGDYWKLAPAALLCAAAWSSATYGPLPGVASFAADATSRTEASAARTAIRAIPPDEPVAASYALMPSLSSREKFYGLHYACLGVTQFGEKEYRLPPEARWLAFDSRDILTYRAQFPPVGWTAPHYDSCIRRLAELGGAPVSSSGTFTVYDREAAPRVPVKPNGGPVTVLPKGIRLISSVAAAIGDGDGSTSISVSALWSAPPALRPDDFEVGIALLDENDSFKLDLKIPLSTFLDGQWPLGSGPWLMSVDLPAEKIKTGRYRPVLTVRTAGSGLLLDARRSTAPDRSSTKAIGSVELQPFNLE